MQRDQHVVANMSVLFNNDANNLNATCNTVGTVWTVVADHVVTHILVLQTYLIVVFLLFLF